jgi:hypothetical protein
MSEPERELVGGIRGIDDDQINYAVIDGRKLMAKASAALDQVVANGLQVDATVTMPGLHRYLKLVFGDSFAISTRVRIAKDATP